MDVPDLYVNFIVALAIGLVIGIERGWSQRETPEGQREAGVRTFTLLALTGFAAALGAKELGPWFAAAAAMGVLALLIVGYATEARHPETDRGMTTETAAFLTFVLGALAGVGQALAAAVIGVVTLALLEQKDTLHGFLKRLQRLELTSAVKLLLVSVVLLPVLPNAGYGPGGVLNPYELWWAVIVIAAIGLVGYAAMKIAGPERGALAMGFTGGLVSSTGVTINAARASKDAPEASAALVGAIATAQCVMFARTAVLVAAMNPKLLEAVALPLALGAATAVAGALIVTRGTVQPASGKLSPGSPDTLAGAIQFMIVVTGVLLLAHAARNYAGDIGFVLSALISGALDVDAATVTASRLVEPDAAPYAAITATAAVAAAIAANSVVKAGIAHVMGTRALAWPATALLLAAAAASLGGVALEYWRQM
jgi:uncharacterized membrane protein (DUF4010 family)